MIEKQFVDSDIAAMLKELKFNEPCIAYFNCHHNGSLDFHYDGHFTICEKCQISEYFGDNCSAPLWQQVFDWLRVNFDIWVSMDYGGKEGTVTVCVDGDYIYEDNGVVLKRFEYSVAQREAVLMALKKIQDNNLKFRTLLRKYQTKIKLHVKVDNFNGVL